MSNASFTLLPPTFFFLPPPFPTNKILMPVLVQRNYYSYTCGTHNDLNWSVLRRHSVKKKQTNKQRKQKILPDTDWKFFELLPMSYMIMPHATILQLHSIIQIIWNHRSLYLFVIFLYLFQEQENKGSNISSLLDSSIVYPTPDDIETHSKFTYIRTPLAPVQGKDTKL